MLKELDRHGSNGENVLGGLLRHRNQVNEELSRVWHSIKEKADAQEVTAAREKMSKRLIAVVKTARYTANLIEEQRLVSRLREMESGLRLFARKADVNYLRDQVRRTLSSFIPLFLKQKPLRPSCSLLKTYVELMLFRILGSMIHCSAQHSSVLSIFSLFLSCLLFSPLCFLALSSLACINSNLVLLLDLFAWVSRWFWPCPSFPCY